MRVVEYRDKENCWYLCHVLKQKPEGILVVQIPNPHGAAWIIDLWPGEYKEIC